MVSRLIERARRAQKELEQLSEAEVRKVVLACARAVLEPQNNYRLSHLAVETTGIGRPSDKILKNEKKTLGLLNDLKNAVTFGIVKEDRELGLVEIVRPVGVVGAITPSTNPIATPLNNIINAIICRNAIILSPSPKGSLVLDILLQLIEEELKRSKILAPQYVIQRVPHTNDKDESKKNTMELMEQVDLVVCTGSRNNVRNSYRSGNAALGVGVGNATVIVDETADLAEAAKKIKQSKTFDYATSCSSENSLILVQSIYSRMLEELQKVGGRLLSAEEKNKVQSIMWIEGKLNPEVIAQPIDKLIKLAGLTDYPNFEFLIVEENGVGNAHPFSGEKLSPVLTLYQANDFAAAKSLATKIYDYQGKGHSVGIHTTDQERARNLGLELEVARVIVNQPHCFAVGGGVENNLPYSLSMGCGTWGKNSFSDNLNYRHFLNQVKIAYPIKPKSLTWDKIVKDFIK